MPPSVDNSRVRQNEMNESYISEICQSFVGETLLRCFSEILGRGKIFLSDRVEIVSVPFTHGAGKSAHESAVKFKPAANPIFVRLTSFKTRKVPADGVVHFGQFPET